MKILVKCLAIMALLCSCSSDGENEGEMAGPNFSFTISGAINKTMSGTGVVFNQTTTDAKDLDGNDVTLTTLLIIAQDSNSECQVIFAITREGGVGADNYPVGTDIFTFYNAFMNFSGDSGETISYQSEAGSIQINSNSFGSVSGSVDVTCPALGGDGTITVKGNFTAESV